MTTYCATNACTITVPAEVASNWPEPLNLSAITRCGRCRCVLGSPGEPHQGLPVACLCPGHRPLDYCRRLGLGHTWWYGRRGR